MLMKRTPMRDYMLIALGALLMAIGSKNIYDPNQLVVGGVTGLGIILRSWIGMPLWLSNTLLNIPLFLAAWKFLGAKFIGRTLYGAAMLSFFLWLLPGISLIPDGDLLLAAVFGGIGSIPGAMIGGVLLGIIEIFAKAYISTQLSDAIVFVVLIVVLIVKRTGLLGKKVNVKV